MRLWKVLDVDRRPFHGGVGQWPEPGVWTDVREIDPCRSGWHLCRDRDMVAWLGPEIWVAEHDPAHGLVELDDKVVVGRARLVERAPWDERTARLFAADCAESVLHLFEAAQPGDDRPRQAILTARRFAFGLVGTEGLAAACAAAWDVACDAAWDAVRAAAWGAGYAAGWDAARDAASAAAWGAGWDAARDAQSDRLVAYLSGAVDLAAIREAVAS